jgi:methylated-DNA-[protein]-cysteine S-methyltransferase
MLQFVPRGCPEGIVRTALPSPLAVAVIVGDDSGVHEVILRASRAEVEGAVEPDALPARHAVGRATRQLAEYFAGARREFDLPLAVEGTPFQRRVWEELCRIPAGVTISYGELARRVGRQGAARAVGAANGRNPIPVIIPCHRVIASTGGLGGFRGGLDLKSWLLAHESAAGGDLFQASAVAAGGG